MIDPTIQHLTEIKLVGSKVQMSYMNNRTREIWQSFMPRRKEIIHVISSDLYSVELYPSITYFEQFNPNSTFEKWAAVQVSEFESIPKSMEILTIPSGQYAVFPFKGTVKEAAAMYQYILNTWIPQSSFMLDHRPHFAVMGEKYKNNDPDSEEEFWVPIKSRSND